MSHLYSCPSMDPLIAPSAIHLPDPFSYLHPNPIPEPKWTLPDVKVFQPDEIRKPVYATVACVHCKASHVACEIARPCRVCVFF